MRESVSAYSEPRAVSMPRSTHRRVSSILRPSHAVSAAVRNAPSVRRVSFSRSKTRIARSTSRNAPSMFPSMR